MYLTGRIVPGWLAQLRQQRIAFDIRRSHAAQQQVAVVFDLAAQALLARQPLDIALRHRTEAAFLPGIDRHHEVTGEAFHQMVGHRVGEAFLVERGDRRVQARVGVGHRSGAEHGAEHQPGWNVVFAGTLRPCEARAAHQPAIDQDGVRPGDVDGGFRLRHRGQRVDQRHHAGIERATRSAQRLLRFQHQREFGEIEAPDMDQRARALFRRERVGVGESVAHFAQAHRRERRRQRQFRL